ncbi:hypothetical protein [Lignipirellula cremea]|uniref:hypothetical protein n=1 Tax=Lignipirellula cremea TaxID=2528010 RepID=UPI0011A624DD|nr:hypothetical protein [Lignipirellula cremea]
MRLARQIISVALLAFYVAHVAGGQALHLGLCAAGVDSCCSDRHCHTSERSVVPDCSTAARHSHCQCHHSVAEESQPEDRPSGEHHPHDSSRCWVCQVFSLAQAQPVAFTVESVAAVWPATPPAAFEIYLSPSRSGCRSRAPPVI